MDSLYILARQIRVLSYWLNALQVGHQISTLVRAILDSAGLSRCLRGRSISCKMASRPDPRRVACECCWNRFRSATRATSRRRRTSINGTAGGDRPELLDSVVSDADV